MRISVFTVAISIFTFPAFADQVNSGTGTFNNNNGTINNGAPSSEVRENRIVVAPGLGGLVGTSCMGSSQASVGALTFGIGVGSSWEDTQCTLRENIVIVSHFDVDLAREMVNDLHGVKEAQERLHPTTQKTFICANPEKFSTDTYNHFCK